MNQKEELGASGEAIFRHKAETGASWQETAEHFGLTYHAARSRARTYQRKNGLQAPQIIGGFDEEPRESSDEIWKRAIQIQKRQAQKQEYKASRRVIYDAGPVVLIAMADLHLGGEGVNYLAIQSDLRLLQELDEMGVNIGVVLVGDAIDNYIVGKLKNLRITESPFLAVEEWGLVDYALDRLAPYLIGSVAGNHDNWSWALTGIDILRERHRELTPGILYDPYELSFILQVGGFECRVMARHKWRGNSMYNPTHGVESKQHTLGRHADVYIMAHTHRGSLAREINNGNDVAHALVCGSYKEHDTYAMQLGLPPSLPTSAVAVVVKESGIWFSASNVWALPEILS